jgi:hypothetical protein
MDTYIKLILALPEDFFKDWVWQDGDKFLNKEPGSINWNESAVGDIEISDDNRLMQRITDDEYYITGEIRPLPNQKQLQSMINLSPIKFLEDIFEFAGEYIPNDADLSIYSIDMDCFTLAYVVDRKYGKYWTGDKWK